MTRSDIVRAVDELCSGDVLIAEGICRRWGQRRYNNAFRNDLLGFSTSTIKAVASLIPAITAGALLDSA